MTNANVVAELRKLLGQMQSWANNAKSYSKTTDQGRKEAYKAFCDENANRGYSKEDVFKAGWQAARQAEREVALEEAAQLADPEKYTCEDSCAVGKVRDAILALKAPTEIPARPSIAQQSGKLPDSPVKRDSLNGPEALAKPLTENQVRHSLDAASRGEWEGVNVQVLTKKLNAIICKKPTKEPPNVGSD